MNYRVRRIFVEKKPGFDVEARSLYNDLKDNLGIAGLTGVRLVNRYDVSGITDEEYSLARDIVFAEPTVDNAYDENIKIADDEKVFAVEYLPGQYDQRADSAAQCVQILTQKERPMIFTAKLIILKGLVSEQELAKIKAYCINHVESREAQLEKPLSFENEAVVPEDVEVLHGFIDYSEEELARFLKDGGMAMSLADLKFCQDYFKTAELRNPTITELKVIDTYWSDHCRHTTFNTNLTDIQFEEGLYTTPIKMAYEEYLKSREAVYGDHPKEMCLMDIAVMGMKELKKQGKLNDLDESDEINACSIEVDADINGEVQKWLVMFKNETHNHPTEIEPFGGAATCLGGAIRDPLSGRSYVYQAMRVTGSGDPRTKIEDTLSGKLPQRKITLGAAAGYSSYGNQIGLATGQVAEIYDEQYVAKRMEIGAVIGAAPKSNVKRLAPENGDIVLLLGGRTGRDGCGGATGSSKEHTVESLATCGAEVQKGNAPTERKIQRLFRNPLVSGMIKRCNDFGAGGVSVAIGELTDGLEINLDAVPKKYEGLDGTELAISESQERMAVVVAPENVDSFKNYAAQENLECTEVAKVTADNRLKMFWREKTIVNLSREFLDTNGVRQTAKVMVKTPDKNTKLGFLSEEIKKNLPDIKKAWLANLEDLNVCSQKGLVERFDSTIGAATVLMPFGGKYQLTPIDGMVAKLPVLEGETNTATAMTYGYNPKIASWSPFHGGFYAVLEAVSKVVALGGDYRKIRLSLQEYFEKLGSDEAKWGKPFSALLGAFYAQKQFGIPAIGGKDSMSGTFMQLNVPPTLVAFAVDVVKADKVISPEFKYTNSKVVLLHVGIKEDGLPDFDALTKMYQKLHELIMNNKVLAASVVKAGGLAACISKMCFGNKIGINLVENCAETALFAAKFGEIVVEVPENVMLTEFGDVQYTLVGYTNEQPVISVNGVNIELSEALEAWQKPLEKIFTTKVSDGEQVIKDMSYSNSKAKHSSHHFAKPRILIPVFPGTNCEYDSARAFEKAGGVVETLVIKNLTPKDIDESISHIVSGIKTSQIVMIPGGFSAGDEPDGSGKFIAAMFRNPRIKDAISELLNHRDGLMLGICNGFQALIKLGLVPYGQIIDITPESPTLTFNTIGRHISRMVETKIASNLSPWFNNVNVGDVHTIAVSHGEGRFVATAQVMDALIKNGQIATQYLENINGSTMGVEGITSPDGRILGKMGHSERIGAGIAINVPGEKDQKIFEAGIRYYK